MSSALNQVYYLLDYTWSIWCGLLKTQTTWWDPYGATFGAFMLLLFVGLAVKFVRE